MYANMFFRGFLTKKDCIIKKYKVYNMQKQITMTQRIERG